MTLSDLLRGIANKMADGKYNAALAEECANDLRQIADEIEGKRPATSSATAMARPPVDARAQVTRIHDL